MQANGTYQDEVDQDGGVSSDLGFHLVFEADGWLGVFDRQTGHRYARPTQAEQEAEGRRLAEQRQRDAEERQRLAEDKQRLAEDKQRLEAEARQLAEEKIQALQREIERLRLAGEQQPPANE